MFVKPTTTAQGEEKGRPGYIGGSRAGGHALEESLSDGGDYSYFTDNHEEGDSEGCDDDDAVAEGFACAEAAPASL